MLLLPVVSWFDQLGRHGISNWRSVSSQQQVVFHLQGYFFIPHDAIGVDRQTSTGSYCYFSTGYLLYRQ